MILLRQNLAIWSKHDFKLRQNVVHFIIEETTLVTIATNDKHIATKCVISAYCKLLPHFINKMTVKLKIVFSSLDQGSSGLVSLLLVMMVRR